MAILSRRQQTGWDARMERIRTGQTMVQRADAEGTVPLQLSRRQGAVKQGFHGLTAWGMGGLLAWMSGTVVTTFGPSAQLLTQYELEKLAAPIEAYGDPVLAFVIFLVALSFMRVNGFIAKLLGFTVLAWLFANQAGVEMPLVADLVEMGKAVISGEMALADTVVALREWAATALA